MAPDTQRDPWRLEDFAASLTASSNNTVAAYSADVRDFVGWAARGSVISPDAVQRTLLRRNHAGGAPAVVLEDLRLAVLQAERAASLESLLGVERKLEANLCSF